MARSLLALLLLALAAVLVLPLGRRERIAEPRSWRGRAAFSASASGELRAGAAKVKIPVHPGASLAGYAGFRTWDGTGEDVFARALVIEAGGLRQIIVSLETLLVSADLEEEIFRRAQLPETACAMITATHTHSGPGGTWDNALAAALGNGRFDREQRAAVAQAAANAIVTAAAQLRPASFFTAQRRLAAAVSRSGAAVDPMLTVLRLDADSGPLATVVVYGMHATEHGRGKSLSGDWPAEAARRLEALGGVALVLQGAVGNATFSRGLNNGIAVAAKAAEASSRGASPSKVALACALRIVALPPPQASGAIAWPLRRAAANVLSLADPALAAQVHLSVGSLRLFGVPGEPVGPLGLAYEAAYPNSAVVGLADGYLGYVETPEAFTAGTGEAGKSYFGPELARILGL